MTAGRTLTSPQRLRARPGAQFPAVLGGGPRVRPGLYL